MSRPFGSYYHNWFGLTIQARSILIGVFIHAHTESLSNTSILVCVALTCQDDWVSSLTDPDVGLRGGWGAHTVNLNTQKL